MTPAPDRPDGSAVDTAVDRHRRRPAYLSPGALVIYAMFILAGVVFFGMKFGMREVIRAGGPVPPDARAIPQGAGRGPWQYYDTGRPPAAAEPATSSDTEGRPKAEAGERSKLP